ncbi:hypothetical protein RvY_15890 [Ramazzottius varieornatus]|uniref:Endoplasmic reticulum resident protein 29 n=1 Tax=Ramazzottius varieornatus TaxID=947166 RepID=A0A1D1VWH7_RAMVA|nr:hypothetical protein RvY_15890 [Ramazzottius varieornatus]
MESTMQMWLATLCVALVGLNEVETKDAKGSVPLDIWTWDKIMPHFRVAAVKFDRVFPYGDKHDEYIKVAEAAHTNKDVLIAEVNAADYGEKRNMDLAEKYGVGKDDYPQLKLFIRGNPEPINYTGNWQADEIKRFLKTRGGVWIGLSACIEEFDELARLFMMEEDEGKKRGFLAEAENKVSEMMDETAKKNAKIYIHTMKKTLEKGRNFVNEEIARLDKLATGKLSDVKKQELLYRNNILHSFKDEL